MKWITREHPKIDRIACPWLIKRFIDTDAEIIYVPFDEVISKSKELNATPFDIADVEYTHYNDECTFDYFLKKHQLDDEALHVLAPIIRCADTVLVWVNPIEQGKDRKKLDSLLLEISNRGCFVSTHPEVILKIGTKEVLYTTKDMEWGGDIKIYRSYEDFTSRFVTGSQTSGVRVSQRRISSGFLYKVNAFFPAAFATVTIFFNASFVSGQCRVFNPQSGFIHKFCAGITCNAFSTSNSISVYLRPYSRECTL